MGLSMWNADVFMDSRQICLWDVWFSSDSSDCICTGITITQLDTVLRQIVECECECDLLLGESAFL